MEPLDEPELRRHMVRYKPRCGWYLHDAFGIHGLGHAARVLVLADVIGRHMLKEALDLDLEAVRWAAALHDIRRLDDGRDLNHGKRSADWVRDSQSPLQDLDELSRERVAYCCEWHVPPDHEAPDMTLELACLKDADSLDRVRLGGLDYRFLRTTYAQALCSEARLLHDASVSLSGIDPWDAVYAGGLSVGVWERNTSANSGQCR